MPDLKNLFTKSISEIAPLIQSREISPVDLTREMLKRIESVDNSLLSYAYVTKDLAMKQAKQAEEEIITDQYRGALHGIPVAVKDLFFTKDIPTTCSSKVLRGWVPEYNADAVEKLNRAGAIMLGKLSMTEFAAAGYHPSADPPKNPWNFDHCPGVSSSGSGAATAAGLCFASLGTDTGGSIRMPSAACGIAGLKPTFGRISRYGVYPLSNSLDHVGPMARSVDDLKILFDELAGYDERDHVSVHPPSCASLSFTEKLKGLRIGIDCEYITRDVEPDITDAIMKESKILQDLGAELHEIDLSFVKEICRYWKPVLGAEANMVHQASYAEKPHEYGPVFADILEFGSTISGQEIGEALLECQRLQHKLSQLFEGIDIILCPTEPFSAPSWEVFPPQLITPLDALAKVLRFSAPYNFSGNPALALPCGFGSNGLPLSMQLIGPQNGDETLLKVGSLYQQVTEWHKQHPHL